MKFRFFLSSFILLFIIIAGFSTESYAVSSDILVNITPPNPIPHKNTTITLKSYVDNLDSALITWSVDGKNVSSEVGKKSFSINAPGAGLETNVTATISLPDGIVEKKIVIKPVVMTLLWQAVDSYVPPFYRGKALPTPDSEVKVVAMPEINSSSGFVSPQNMVYAWKKDYTNNVDGSGYGKNSFTFVNDYLDDSNNISVTASTIDQKYSSDANININTTQPKILFYKNDNTLGTIWSRILTDTYKMEGNNETIEAIPYFISPEQLIHPVLVWKWFINDSRVELPSFRQNLMPLQTEAGTHGTSRLKLEINNTNKLFQTTAKEINIEF